MSKQPIRVIVIDPYKKTVTETEIVPELKEYYRIIGCGLVEASYDGEILGYGEGQHFLFVDEEGLFNPNRQFFHIKGAHSPLTGIGIVLRSDEEGEGETIACTLPLETVQAAVKFYSEQDLREIYGVTVPQ